MLRRLATAALLLTLLAPIVHGADDVKSRMKDVLRERIATDAKKADTKQTPVAAAPVGEKPEASAAAKEKGAPVTKNESSKAKGTAKATNQNPTLLPQVEVRKSRITELDQQLAKQEQDIARERKNLKVSEVDAALNDSKLARPLAIFGGESSQFRQHVASERVELMEFEKDLMEAIAHAKTKQEKQELQKQLDDMRMVRRELEKSLR